MEETEKICIQNTSEYQKELKSLMEMLYSKRSKHEGNLKRSVLDRVPKDLTEEILLVLEKKSKQPAEVRRFLTWLNAQVVVKVVSAYAPTDKLQEDK